MIRLSKEERAIVDAGKAISRRVTKAKGREIKASRQPEKKTRGRERDNGYLQYVRRLSCTTCQAPAPNDAAHLRMACREIGKSSTGMQVKPSDKYAVPLCRTCHTTQHAGSEARFWAERGIDPFKVAASHYAAYQSPSSSSNRGDRT